MLGRAREVLFDHTVRLWEDLDAGARAYREERGTTAVTLQAIYVLLGATVCLIGIRYLGNEDDVKRLLWLVDALGLDSAREWLHHHLRVSADRKINLRVFWCIARMTFYGVLPAIIVLGILRGRLADYGVRRASSYRTYVLLFLIVLPFVVLASYSPAFQAKYPYFRTPRGESLWPNQFYWALLYGSQFFALEFFFRGYFLHGLKKVFGSTTVLVPIIPYVMIHFGKPLPETVGAAVTGFVLGTLSLRTGSILGGAGVHVAVAWSMDLCSLAHRGHFERFR